MIIDTITLKIINPRNDGSFLVIEENEDDTLYIELQSVYDRNDIVDEGIIKKEQLYKWIEDHIDW